MPKFRYVIPIGKHQLWVEGDAPTNAALFAQAAELAEVFPAVCGHCGSDALRPRTWKGKWVSYEFACLACDHRLKVNARKDGGLYIKDHAWVPPQSREGGSDPNAPNGNGDPASEPSGGEDWMRKDW